MIWVGDDAERPDSWISTWRENHCDWEFRLWGNEDLAVESWTCGNQLRLLTEARRWEGVADIMRYEILLRHGGVYADSDSVSVRPLDDELLDRRMFAVWENEAHAPGLVANGFIGAEPEHPALRTVIGEIAKLDHPLRLPRRWLPWSKKAAPWKTTGPQLFTRVVSSLPPEEVTILPSSMFLPRHYTETAERDEGVIYARHFWSTTSRLLAATSGKE